jgi:3-hydroxyacyl-CoA dehydrogenase
VSNETISYAFENAYIFMRVPIPPDGDVGVVSVISPQGSITPLQDTITPEAIIENLNIKRQLMESIDAIRSPNTIISTNTSGIQIASIAEGRSDGFRKHFLGTHFFNPPRYLKLLEIIPSPDTLPEVLRFVEEFGEKRLGKGIVPAKDTPNFVANRIGVFSMLHVIRTMMDLGLSVEAVDKLTGPVIGHPKSASFRTADLVGLDTLVHVADNVYDGSPDDEKREIEEERLPAFQDKWGSLSEL